MHSVAADMFILKKIFTLILFIFSLPGIGSVRDRLSSIISGFRFELLAEWFYLEGSLHVSVKGDIKSGFSKGEGQVQ